MSKPVTVTVGVCIPCQVRLTATVDEGGDLDVTHAEVVGESIAPRRLIEHIDDEDWWDLAAAVRKAVRDE